MDILAIAFCEIIALMLVEYLVFQGMKRKHKEWFEENDEWD